MKAFEASTVINAPAERIWAILTDAAAYPDWEPNILRIEGQIAVGEKIAVYTSLSPNRAFPVRVAELVPNQRMVWAGGMPMGLFRGIRTFTLTPVEKGIKVHTREEFSGLLLPLFSPQIGDLQPSFDTFVASLKARAEAQ